MIQVDVLIIGAGAGGLMCAIEAAKRQRSVLIIDHANKPGKKILMSGGGRCNFTNYHATPHNYLSNNIHFCKSALNRYTPWDFIALVKKHHIDFHEKKHGQLFCDNKSKDILNMLLAECEQWKVNIQLEESIYHVEKMESGHFRLKSSKQIYQCESLVIASGGLSIPSMGASPFGYQIAQQFGLNIQPTRAALVPLTWHAADKDRFYDLSGISNESKVQVEKQIFHENILFTHRGLSGPAILQISNYWRPGQNLCINLLPNTDLFKNLQSAQKEQPKISLKEFLSQYLAKRVVLSFLDPNLALKPLHSISHHEFLEIATIFHQWQLKPNGTEGYRTAEVTLGGVDCDGISSKTMEAYHTKGLYFIGEVLDVTGWLGGYNFQWAWSSGWAAGQVA